jgi:hypothetical protein
MTMRATRAEKDPASLCGAALKRCSNCEKSVGQARVRRGLGCPKCPDAPVMDSTCREKAGERTEHEGIGPCWRHGGKTWPHNVHAQSVQVAEAVRTLGLRDEFKNVSELEALYLDLWRTLSQIAWTEDIIAELSAEDVFWGRTMEETETEVGHGTGQREGDTKRDHARVRREARLNIAVAYLSERQTHLLRLASTMASLGLEERRQTRDEQVGRFVADIIRAFLAHPRVAVLLGELAPRFQEEAPDIVLTVLMRAGGEVVESSLVPA